MKKIYKFSAVLGLGLVLAGGVLAADLAVPGKNDPNVTVGANQTKKNLYAVGGNVTVNGQTLGDLTVAGGMVTVDGNVEQDLMAAGASMSISSAIGGDARIAGGNVTISGPITGDLVIAGGNITLTAKSSIGGDLLIAGGNVTLDAPVKGSVKAAGGNLTLNSKIEGSVFVQNSRSLSFGEKAEIAGEIRHKGPAQASVAQGAKIASINYTEWQPRKSSAKNAAAAFITIGFFIKLAAWMLAGWLVSRLKPSWVRLVAEGTRTSPWQSLGKGLAVLVAVPVAFVLLLISIVGYYVAFIVMAVYVLLLMLSGVFAALTLGRMVSMWIFKATETMPMWQPVVIGAVVWNILSLVPVVGWIILFATFLLSLGALVSSLSAGLKES